MDQSFKKKRTIQNLRLQGNFKRLSQLYFRNRWTYKTNFFNFLFFSQKLTNVINSNLYKL